MARSKSLEQQAVDLLRKQGWEVEIVQHKIRGRRLKDLFGCIDILAIKAGHPIAGIQVTNTGNLNARIRKILDEPRMKTWLAAGASLEAWGFEDGELKKIHIFHPSQWDRIKSIRGDDDNAVVEVH